MSTLELPLRSDFNAFRFQEDLEDSGSYEGEVFSRVDDSSNLEAKKEYSFQESQDRILLEVKYDFTEEEIRNAYVELRKKYNPHTSKENAKKFSEIQGAYKRLTEINK